MSKYYTKRRNERKVANAARCVRCDISSGCPGRECPICSDCLFGCDCPIPDEAYRAHYEDVVTALDYASVQNPIWTRSVASLSECQCACFEPCYCAYFKGVTDFPYGHAPSKDSVYHTEMSMMIADFTIGRYSRREATELYWTLYEH